MTLCEGNVPSKKSLSYLYPIQATQSSLAERSLKITSFDVYRKRHRFVGQVVVPLRDHLRLGADDLFDGGDKVADDDNNDETKVQCLQKRSFFISTKTHFTAQR